MTRLEKLSDKVRSGEAIEFAEAIEVISYQEHLRKHTKKNKWYNKLLNLLTPKRNESNLHQYKTRSSAKHSHRS
jgi:hypothetical protein